MLSATATCEAYLGRGDIGGDHFSGGGCDGLTAHEILKIRYIHVNPENAPVDLSFPFIPQEHGPRSRYILNGELRRRRTSDEGARVESSGRCGVCRRAVENEHEASSSSIYHHLVSRAGIFWHCPREL